MSGTIAVLLKPEAVIGPYKNSQNILKIFQLSRKTPAAACQSRDIMAQISIDTLYGEGVIFAVNIEDMLPRKDGIQISRVPICAITFRIRGCVYHLLNRFGGLITAHNMAYDLPRLPAYHRHDVDIFPCFCAGLALQKPV